MISITIPTTARQDTKLAKILSTINAQRASNGQPPFVDVADMFLDLLKKQISTYTDAFDQQDGSAVVAAYLAASDTVQARVRSDLGL